MDTLTAASLNLPSLPPQPRRSTSHRFNPTVNPTASSASTNLSIPTSSSTYSYNKNSNFPCGISFHAKYSRAAHQPSPPRLHEKAASGFAAALVTVCQSKNCLGRTRDDVRRLIEFLVGKDKNKYSVNDVVERGKFGKHLKGLVNMLIARGESGILVDVLTEFERICHDLVVVRTTKLVWVS